MNKPFLLLVSCAGLAVVMTIPPARSEFKPIGASGSAESTPNKKATTIEARLDAIRTRMSNAEGDITKANGNLSCEGDSQCEVLEMGDRQCGGPSRYLIVSTANPKLTEVKAKIEAYTKAEKELNMADTQLGCTDAPKAPNVLCKAGKCQ